MRLDWEERRAFVALNAAIDACPEAHEARQRWLGVRARRLEVEATIAGLKEAS